MLRVSFFILSSLYSCICYSAESRKFELMSQKAFAIHTIGNGTIEAKNNAVCINLDNAKIFIADDWDRTEPVCEVRLGLAHWKGKESWDALWFGEATSASAVLSHGVSLLIENKQYCLPYQGKLDRTWVVMEIASPHEEYGFVTSYAHEPRTVSQIEALIEAAADKDKHGE